MKKKTLLIACILFSAISLAQKPTFQRYIYADTQDINKYQKVKNGSNVLEYETAILEVAEHAQVHQDTDKQQHAPSGLARLKIELVGHHPIDNRGQPQQDHKRWIPGGIK